MAIEQLLQTTRLLMLIGAGGVGKTRLALRVGSAVAHRYAGGVWLVDLAPVADATLVPKAFASALDVQEQPGRPLVDTLAVALRRRALLLLLDNCETAWRVPALQMPELADVAAASRAVRTEAVQLFVERARAVQPAFVLNDLNVSAVVQVCRQLDGIPCRSSLPRPACRRSVSIRSPLDSTIASRFSRRVVGRRSRGSRPCTACWEAAVAVCPVPAARVDPAPGEGVDVDEIQAGEILDLLAQLVGKSPVVADTQGEMVRYWLLETVRQYAWEHLRMTIYADGGASLMDTVFPLQIQGAPSR